MENKLEIGLTQFLGGAGMNGNYQEDMTSSLRRTGINFLTWVFIFIYPITIGILVPQIILVTKGIFRFARLCQTSIIAWMVFDVLAVLLSYITCRFNVIEPPFVTNIDYVKMNMLIENHASVIGLAEVRLLIFSLGKTIKGFEKDLETMNEDSDERGNIVNDLTLCDNLMAKLSQMEAQKVKDIEGGPPPQ